MPGHKLTPGAWEVVEQDDGSVVISANEGYVRVAQVSGRSEEEAQFNARMMAASKDLYDACGTALGALTNGGDQEAAAERLRDALRRVLDDGPFLVDPGASGVTTG